VKKSLSHRIVSTLVVVALLFGAFAAGNVSGYMARPAFASDQPSEFEIFWEAWHLVLEHFVDRDQIDYSSMTYGAIQGMLDSLGDQNHTVFFTQEEAEQQSSSLQGSFEGIGAYVSIQDGFFTVVAPIHGSPAEEAGILAGDVVLKVNGEEITGLPQWDVISKIRGESGTSVTLTVLHSDKETEQEIQITRGKIDIDSVLWSRVPNSDLAYVQITQFAADTSRELSEALTAIQAEGEKGEPVSGIILDLRNILDEDQIILHEQDADDNVATYRARSEGLALDMPMVVLINEGSASAAEIVAGALQANERAKLVGEVTLGTGTVLRPFNLSDGSVVRLGITNWLTPDYDLIKNQGVQPDVMVEQAPSVEMIDGISLAEMDRSSLYSHDDRQFASALTLLRVQVRQQER
jgi:carboxyl-terminal processing protease